MICRASSVAQKGSKYIVTKVESCISNGIPDFKIIGLADTVIKESSARVKNAIVNSGLVFPTNKITINMLPANFSKRGSHFDLAIAISILQSTNQVKNVESDEYAFFGELSLSGNLIEMENILPHIIEATEMKFKTIFIPKLNRIEENIVSNIVKNSKIVCASSLREVVDYINGDVKKIGMNEENEELRVMKNNYEDRYEKEKEQEDSILGHENVKRALLISIAGGHNMLMVGSPGVGKTQIADICKNILPELDYESALEVMKIYSISDKIEMSERDIFEAPFRKPRVNISVASMVGGGVIPKPGEVSLAHKGVLFLDELPNFSGDILRKLTQIIDDKIVNISREKANYVFQSDFILLCAMNPCKCGYYGDDSKNCTCSQGEIQKYTKNVTGALMDRIDIKIRVNRIDREKWDENFIKETVNEYNMKETKREKEYEYGCEFSKRINMNSEQKNSSFVKNHHMSIGDMKKIVIETRKIQKNRNSVYNITSGEKNYLNGNLRDEQIEQICKIGKEERKFLNEAYDKLKMSHRGYKKILKLSRTIADLEGKREIEIMDIAEALQYRENADL